MELNKIYNENCLDTMGRMPDGFIDLIVTSPPYADRRMSAYGGTREDQYIEWFLPIAEEIKRIMKPTASFFLNIKTHTSNGERSLYVFDLVSKLKRDLGFLFVDEFCWTKNPFPGSLKGRFKNAFEPVYHFTKSNPRNITFNPIAMGTPMKEESIARSFRKQCGTPANGSKMTGMNTTNIRNLKIARPSNVINVNNVSNQFSDKKNHPATFPEGLSDFFIESFSNAGDIVYDPFSGSGTTCLSARRLDRRYIGSELLEKYYDLSNKRIKERLF